MRLKLLPITGGLLFLCCTFVMAAGPYADPSFDHWGDNWRSRSVLTSTDTVVVISTPIAHAGLETSDSWRKRHIVNIGGAELALYPTSSGYAVFESTRGIHLSSYTVSAPYPKEAWIDGNALIYGIWGTAGTETNAGAIVNEFYDKR